MPERGDDARMARIASRIVQDRLRTDTEDEWPTHHYEGASEDVRAIIDEMAFCAVGSPSYMRLLEALKRG